MVNSSYFTSEMIQEKFYSISVREVQRWRKVTGYWQVPALQ